MHALIASMSWPWYIFVGAGFFVGLLLWSEGFRSEIESLLAHMLGMKPRKGGRRD